MVAVSADPLQISDVTVILPVEEPVATAAVYTALLGPSDDGRSWAAGNGSIVLVDDGQLGPWAAFEVADADVAAALLARRGLPLAATAGHAVRAETVPAVGITANAGARPGAPMLDHIVFTTDTVDAAVALFAGRLGMDLRLARSFGDLTQVFLRTSSVVVEVLAGGDRAHPGVQLWGLAWRCGDLDAEHARLTAAGLSLSEVREGRKPGTRVATVREPALGTPTILLEQRPPQ